MKKISFLVLIVALLSVFAFSSSAKCAGGCVYSTSPWCDVCGEQIEGECTGSHMYESGYCVICGAADTDSGIICPLTGNLHTSDYCADCGWGTPSCLHSYLGGLHVVQSSSCIKQGIGYRVCLDCGVSIDQVLPYAEHDFVSGVCVACNYTCPHFNYGPWSADSVSSSCNNAGKRERTCLDCGFIDREAVTPGPHTWENGWCTVCGAGSEQNCDHEFGEYSVTKEPTCLVGGKEESTCSLCGRLSTRTINPLGHKFVNAKCERCGVMDEGHTHTVYRTVVLGDDTHVSLCSCGKLYMVQKHNYVEQYTNAPTEKHKPVLQKVSCSECGYERIFYKPDTAVKTHTVANGEKISYNDLFANDCLYYEYTDKNGGEGEFFVCSDNNGIVLGRIVLPSLSVGQKLLVDTKTGYYSVWDDEVSKVKLDVLDWRVQSVQDVYFNFSPALETVPTELSTFNAYFESEFLGEYNYPSVDSSLIGSGYDHIHPYIDRGSGKNIRLISFPQENISEFRADLANYPLTLVIYDFLDQSYESVTNKDDAFTSAFMKMKQNNGMSNGYTPSGDSYERGYADAYNTLTNAVIADNPIQGFMQGMWYGVLAMVTILGNGISIGGISLFSVLVSVVMVVVVYFVFKILGK